MLWLWFHFKHCSVLSRQTPPVAVMLFKCSGKVRAIWPGCKRKLLYRKQGGNESTAAFGFLRSLKALLCRTLRISAERAGWAPIIQRREAQAGLTGLWLNWGRQVRFPWLGCPYWGKRWWMPVVEREREKDWQKVTKSGQKVTRWQIGLMHVLHTITPTHPPNHGQNHHIQTKPSNPHIKGQWLSNLLFLT